MSVHQLLKLFIRSRVASYLLGISILVIATVINLRIPKILGRITDLLAQKTQNPEQVFWLITSMLLIALVAFILRFIWRYLLIGNCRHVESFIRRKLFSHLQTLPVSFYNQHRTGDLVAYAINDIRAVRMIFGFGFIATIEGLLVNAFSIFYMAKTIHPLLTLMAMIPVPVVIGITFMLRKSIRNRFEKVQKAFASISERVQENIMGIRVIKAFAQEKDETIRLKNLSQDNLKVNMKLIKVSGLLGPVTQICFGFSFLFFIILGGRMVIQKTISLGDFVAFNSYMAAIMGPVANVSRIIEIWQKGAASIKRLDAIFLQKSDITDGDTTFESENTVGDIEIRNLSFTYPESESVVLKNIHLKIPTGSTLGIIGKTGSGKTTLVNLLLRLFPVEEGHIFLNGTDINHISIEALRDSIGYVPQDNFLFSTSIKKNIQFYNEGISDEEIEEAAKMSGVYDNILEFKKGFDTMVGERGVALSGGQRQRISIARAIAKNPAVLILDDSLSAVDSKTEAQILSNIHDVLSDRTGILISHRASTVMVADRIIHLEEGVIIESGTHQELMERRGPYWKLFMSQNECDHQDKAQYTEDVSSKTPGWANRRELTVIE